MAQVGPHVERVFSSDVSSGPYVLNRRQRLSAILIETYASAGATTTKVTIDAGTSYEVDILKFQFPSDATAFRTYGDWYCGPITILQNGLQANVELVFIFE